VAMSDIMSNMPKAMPRIPTKNAQGKKKSERRKSQ